MTEGRGRAPALVAELVSDGTLAGTVVTLNGRRISNLAAVDLHLGRDACTLLLSVGHTVIDYGAPAAVDVRGVRASVRPSQTPQEPR